MNIMFANLDKLLTIFLIINIHLHLAKDHVHYNPEILLGNERLLEKFVDCLLDEGPCFGPIAKFKKEIPQIMETNCDQCQDQIKILSTKVMQYIQEHKPEKWLKIQEMYDPEAKHKQKLDELLEKD